MQHERIAGTIRFSVGILLFLWGCFTIDLESPRWGIVSFALFSAPLLLQFTRLVAIRTFALWFGVLTVAQTFVPFLWRSDFVTLPPNMTWVGDFDKQFRLNGIHGSQHASTDAMGFRTTKPVDYAKKNALRIFALGASTTEQLNIDDKKTWCATLESSLEGKLHRPVEVINTGVSATRARHQLGTFRQILKYKPDLVVFLVGVNDWNQLIKQKFGDRASHPRQDCLLKYSPFSDLLSHSLSHWRKQPAPARPSQASQANIQYEVSPTGEQINPYERLRGSLHRQRRYSFNPSQVTREYSSSLAKISSLCHAETIKCLFLTQPSAYDPKMSIEEQNLLWMTPFLEDYTVDLDSMLRITRFFNQYLMDFGQSHDQPVFDLALQLGPSFEYFTDDVHFNEAGSKKVGELVADYLLQHPDLVGSSGVQKPILQ